MLYPELESEFDFVEAIEVERSSIDGLEETLRQNYQPHPGSVGIAMQIFERGIDSAS